VNLEEQIRTYGERVEALATKSAPDRPIEMGTLMPIDRTAGNGARYRLSALAAAVLLVVVLAGAIVATRPDGDLTPIDAGPTTPTDQAGDAAVSEPPPEPDAPISLWLSASRVPPGPVELVAVLVNHTGVDATFGVLALVERWDGQAWIPHRNVSMCLDFWFCTASLAPLDQPLAINDIGLGATVESPGSIERFTTDGLDVGWYRLSQEANEHIVATAVFEVANGAPSPAPLPPVDRPTISVQPALVSLGRGTVNLHSLVPGTSTVGAYEDAMLGLSESATIERWEESSWVPVSIIELSPPPADTSPTDRTAELPSLPSGGYRIVRTGPGGDHVGAFWVADDLANSNSPTPGLEVNPRGPYRDQQDVEVRGVGFEPGTLRGGIGQCPAGVDTARFERCGYWDVDTPVVVAADGTFTLTVRLFATTPHGVSCQEPPGCVLAWVPPRESMVAAVALDFRS